MYHIRTHLDILGHHGVHFLKTGLELLDVAVGALVEVQLACLQTMTGEKKRTCI